jgi:hypothetical protein
MNNSKPLMWRKGLTLSATFLLAAFFLIGCKKKNYQNGEGAINQSELLNSGAIDTFSLQTYTLFESPDSIIADNPALGILGSYEDPVFGGVSSEIYTQFRLQAANPNFGDVSLITIDSVVLGLEYAGYYGISGSQTVEVYRINDPEGMHIDSMYYTSHTLATDMSTLVPVGSETLDFNTSSLTVVGEDTLDPQLRIHLDTNLAWDIINESVISPSTFDSNDDFLQFFQGLHIKTNNGMQASGDGGLFYFNLGDANSKLSIYYTQDGETKVYDLVINSECADFNHVEIVQSAEVQSTFENPTNGSDQFYAQSFGSRARVKFPSVKDIPENAVIHRATLELPIQYQAGTTYGPGTDISVLTYLEESDSTSYFSIGSLGYYDESKKAFTIDLRAYLQAVVSGEVENHGLILSPLLFITSGDRIIFNGPNTTNKAKPKLSIVYTEY